MCVPHSTRRKSVMQQALISVVVLTTLLMPTLRASAQYDDPSPPAKVLKLIFIHHSCGENWLADGDGGLGRALDHSNYHVSDTNYGWGPDYIGDRTDITDWPEWFTGPSRDRFLEALYSESGQNSGYTRTLPDPGGENQIILFKSCFPNSNLEGNPADPAARGEGLTVGNAKAIYNELLGYFSTRPDKLFVAITAPPVQDPTYAANARAFNTWLVQEWLSGYSGVNVAVWDFYNILTATNNHHRFQDGTIEYVTDRGGDTLHYPSGDDHPSPDGNRKATDEFVPMLNVYVHRWLSDATAAPPTLPTLAATEVPPVEAEETAMEDETAPLLEPPVAEVGGFIEDFESETNEWTAFVDAEKDSRLTCIRDGANSYSGTAGLRMEYEIAPDSWAECGLIYPEPMDWSEGAGLAVYVRAGNTDQQVVVVAFQGNSPDELSSFQYRAVTNQEAVDGWQRVDVSWDHFSQPPWEGDGTAKFDPTRSMGLAFLFEATDGVQNSGTLWVDDVTFLASLPPGSEAVTTPPSPEPPAVVTEPTSTSQPVKEPAENGGKRGICPGTIGLGLVSLIGAVWIQRRMR